MEDNKVLTKDRAAQLAEDIGNIAKDILLQLNEYKIKPTLIQEFYCGILVRERIILRDIADILRKNHESNLTSAFILFRVILDDFIRLFSVHASKDAGEEVVKILADAHYHRFKNIEESIVINTKYYEYGKNFRRRVQ